MRDARSDRRSTLAHGGREQTRHLARWLFVTVAAGVALAAFGLSTASSAAFEADAALTPSFHYLDDAPGQTFTLTIVNIGTEESIGAVEIKPPASGGWTITACPTAPAGWDIQTAPTKCRYRSVTSEADDIQVGETNDDFSVTAAADPGTQDRVAPFIVTVSKSGNFSNPDVIIADPSAAMPPGLTVTAHSFQVTDAVVSAAPAAPGTPCPPSDKDAITGSSTTMVICGRNRTTTPLTPTAPPSSLAGSFIASPGSFTSGLIVPTGAAGAPVVLGNWGGATVTSSAGPNKTVVAKIGSSNNQTSPATTLHGYEALNRPPVATDDVASTDENSGTTIDVLANDSDPDGDALTVSSIDTTGTLGSVTNNGSDVSYDPDSQFESLQAGETAQDVFSYTVSDTFGASDTATVTVTITGVNDPPVAVDDEATVGEDGPAVTVDVVANDSDVEGDTLSVSSVDTTGTSGSVTNNGTDVSYDPNGQFDGLKAGETAQDAFTYTASDGNGGIDTATVTVTVTGANDAPTAVDDIANANEDGATNVDVLGNDSDADGDTLSVSNVDTTGTTGSVTNNGTDVTYDPNGQFEALGVGQSAQDVFTYTVSDGNGGTDTATVTVTVHGVNDAPTAVDDTANANENGPAVVIDVLSNDTDPDSSDTLTVAAVDTTGTQGSVTNNGTDVTYDPNGQFDGLSGGQTAQDQFTYTVSDGNGGTDTATVTVTVTGANNAPTATDDDFAGAVGNTTFAVGVTVTGEPAVNVAGNLLTNDTDADGGAPLTASLGTATPGAAVTVNSDGSFRYVSPPGFNGTDSFTYLVSDGSDSDTGNVTIGVADMVWYVDNSKPAGNGTSISPYNSLASLQGADADDPGDHLFVHTGSGSYPGGLVLEGSQKLWGEPHGLIVGGNTLAPPSGTNPVITNAAGDGLTLASGVDVQRVDVANTSGAGVRGTNISTATVGASSSISGAGDVALKLSGGSGNVSVGSSITNSADRSIEVDGRTGGTVSISGNVNDTGDGIALASNTGATIAFSGTLDVSAGGGNALVATGGGTVTATGSGSSLTSTTATALFVQDTTIGAAGLTFESVSSSGATSGIRLLDTGTVGGLTVTGSGTAGSGGSILNSTNHGVELEDSGDVSLNWVTIDGAGNANDEFGIWMARVSGDIVVQDSLIDDTEEGGIRLANSSGAVDLTLRRTTVSNNDVVVGEDGVLVDLSGTATGRVLVDDSTLTELDRDGVDARASSTASLDLTVQNSDVTNNEGSGVVASATNTASLKTTVTGNAITNLTSTGVAVTGAVNSTVNAVVTGNTITHPTPPTAQNGFGIRLAQDEDGDFTARVESNTIAGTGFGGIKVLSRLGNLNSSPGTSSADTGTMHATVRNNTVGLPLNADFGIEVSALNAENSLCAVYTGNTATGNLVAGVRARQASTSTYRVEGLAAGAQTAATMATYLNANNTSVPLATAIATTNYTGVAAGTCRTATSATTP